MSENQTRDYLSLANKSEYLRRNVEQRAKQVTARDAAVAEIEAADAEIDRLSADIRALVYLLGLCPPEAAA